MATLRLLYASLVQLFTGQLLTRLALLEQRVLAQGELLKLADKRITSARNAHNSLLEAHMRLSVYTRGTFDQLRKSVNSSKLDVIALASRMAGELPDEKTQVLTDFEEDEQTTVLTDADIVMPKARK